MAGSFLPPLPAHSGLIPAFVTLLALPRFIAECIRQESQKLGIDSSEHRPQFIKVRQELDASIGQLADSRSDGWLQDEQCAGIIMSRKSSETARLADDFHDLIGTVEQSLDGFFGVCFHGIVCVVFWFLVPFLSEISPSPFSRR